MKTLSLYLPTVSPSLFYLLTLVLPCFSLSDCIKEPGLQTLTRWLLWDIRLLSSWSASFPIKVIFLASTFHLLDSLACCAASRVGLGSVTGCVHFSFLVVQLLSRIQLFATPWTAARQASLPFTSLGQEIKLTLSSHCNCWVEDVSRTEG